MSEENLRCTQENEVEVLKAIYVGDVNDECVSPSKPLRFTVRLLPQKGSSGGGAAYGHKVLTFIVVRFTIPFNYPEIVPEIQIMESKGLSSQEVTELEDEMKSLSQKLIGNVMIYEILTHGEAYLHAHQKTSPGSFHDEMILRKRLLEEESVKMLKDMKEKERQAIQLEVQRKQEELREENRKLKEQRKTQPIPIESPFGNPNGNGNSSPSSPMKGDGGFTHPMGIKPRIKRKSWSANRRRRSNSEGSDSSLSDVSELILLEFPFGKSTTLFYRGQIVGRSDRGSTVYAGMSKSGNLIAIKEWRFAAKLDKKGKEVKSSAFGGGDSLTLEGLMKLKSSWEAEMNLLQKLEDTNIVLYYGVKFDQAIDEPGVIYVYLAEEFVRGTTLQSYLQDTVSLDLSLVRHCAKGILQGLKYLHDNDVVHRFLRDTSVFLDTTGEIKISDYGIERKIYEAYLSFSKLPEVPDKFPPSIGRGGKKGDIYRFGTIILSLIRGQYVENPPEIPANIPPELQDFLKKCLSSVENTRWTSSQLLEHAFLKMPLQRGPTPRYLRQDSDEQENDNADEAQGNREEDEVDKDLLPRCVKGHSRVQSEFETLKWLGKGGFGDVLKVRNKLDGRIYALKRIRLNPRNKQLNKKITREVKLLSQLNHENVVRYFNSWIETVLECEDEISASDTTSKEVTSPPESSPKEEKRANLPIVRFQQNPLKQNSLGFLDNVEDLAPPMSDSEWGLSMSRRPVSEDSDSSDDEGDLFGTSFLRIANEESEEIVFEHDSESEQHDNTSSYGLQSNTNETEKSRALSPESSDLATSPFVRESQFMYIQMEFCEKSTLRTAIDDNLSEDLDRAWRLFREIVEGLVHIHQQGMIHRDLKPVNIFLDSQDHVKIGDFGLATSNIISKTAEEVSILEKDVDTGHSIDFTDESRTGQVGTALYVAPELIVTGRKITYNQKVDIYSLGIIFFEMFYNCPKTSMERVRVIASLRQKTINFPQDFDQNLMPQVTHITKWLLDHDPTQRPTSLELLQSDYLPPPHIEEAELRDIFTRTLNNSQSKAYKYLVAACMEQKISPVEDITYDMETGKPCTVNTCLRTLSLIQRVKCVIRSTFEKHGAVEVSTPLLIPKSKFYQKNETCVNMMCHSGNVVSIPHDLRIPFARFVGRYGISNMRRYSIDKVYRERKIYGLHPKELVECAFDIIDSAEGTLISDSEVVAVVFDIIHEIPWLRNKACTVRVGHTKLMTGVLLHHGVDEKLHSQIIKILADVKVERNTKSQIQTHLCSLGLPDHFITMLFTLMEVEGPFAKVSNILKGITKRKGEAASCIKEGLHELEILVNNIESFGIKCNIVVVPTMAFGTHIYSGLLYQIVCNLKQRKDKMTVDVIAAGGRYDALLQHYRGMMSLEGNTREAGQCGVGISISLDKLIAAANGDEENDWISKGPVDAVVCSLGHHPMAKEKINYMKELLSHGVHCCVLNGSQTLESAEEYCKDIGAMFLVILKEGEQYSQIRVRMWEKGRFNEKKYDKLQDAVEAMSKILGTSGDNFPNNANAGAGGSTRNDTMSKQTGVSSSESGSTTTVAGHGSGLPAFNISFVVQERDKLASWKRRYENQVSNRLSEILPKLAKQQTVEVLGLEVNSAVINNLVACLSMHDKDDFAKGVGEVIEKHPRLKKYLINICDEIYELNFDKNVPVIIIYGLQDNSYRVLL